MKRMRNWNLRKGDPLSLTIAADSRSTSPDYTNDHIWELNIGQGQPPALSLQTTFGLRAKSLRLFPRFCGSQGNIVDPQKFHQPPALRSFHPDYLCFIAMPWLGLEITATYWVPDSHGVSGRLTLVNRTNSPLNFRLEWCAFLNPQPPGDPFTAAPLGMGNLLYGRTAGLVPVCILSGNPDAVTSPYPALAVEVELMPGNHRSLNWAFAALAERDASLALAQRIATRPLDAEIARIELRNSAQTLEIYTGDADWDAAFALSQKVAQGLFFNPNDELPYPSFVLSRQPDDGYSARGDGRDHKHLWSGHTPLDAYYLSSLLLPGNADLCAGLLRNFLSTQEQSGFIDLRPGLAGQRSRWLAQPVLASLALKIDQHRSEHDWLAELYPQLGRSLRLWLGSEHDRDQDGLPEWQHPQQTGIEDVPITSTGYPGDQGVSISTLESPALAAMLYRECRSLLKIARQCGLEDGVVWLEKSASRLKKAVENSWHPPSHSYRYRDFESHKSQKGVPIYQFNGSGEYTLQRSFTAERRLMIHLQTQDQTTRPTTLTLIGKGIAGQVIEKIPFNRFVWHNGSAHYTTEHLYRSLTRLEVNGLTDQDRGWLATVDHTPQDLSLFLPLWAGITSPRRARALIEKNLLPRYRTTHGLALAPCDPSSMNAPYCRISIPWNCLMGEALLAYGYRQAAADLVTRLMDAIVASLKQSNAFYEHYHPFTAQAEGERNHLRGLAPLELFLQVTGIKALRKNSVILDGLNPFPFPITVKYQGMSITRHTRDTVVSFSNGQTITVEGAGAHRVSLE